MGVVDSYNGSDTFTGIIDKMISMLELLVGAVIGSLSMAAKKYFDKSD